MTERSAFLIGAYGVNTGSDLEAAYELPATFPRILISASGTSGPASTQY